MPSFASFAFINDNSQSQLAKIYYLLQLLLPIAFFMNLQDVFNFSFFFLQDQDATEHIGDIFQDEGNMAAILMRRQLENGDLLMVRKQK